VSRIHQILAILVSLLLLAAIVEGGLRLLGDGPRPTMNRFDPVLGWSKEPNASIRRRTAEFDVTLETNSRALREDESRGYAKPAGETRVLLVGDSFTLGYTVERADTLSQLLERRLRAEGRSVEVLNGGTEGYSTDQEVLWLAGEGVKYNPDVVVLQMYENDVFWNAQSSYLRYPKPLLKPEQAPESALVSPATLKDPGREPWLQRHTAIGSLVAGLVSPPSVPLLPGPIALPAEWGVRLRDDAPGWPETEEALRAFRWLADQRGFKPLVLVIPDKAQIDPEARAQMAQAMGNDPAYDPARPYRRMVALARAAGLPVVEPEGALAAASDGGRWALYFGHDWHTNAVGNRVLAGQLDRALAAPDLLGPPPRPLPAESALEAEAPAGAPSHHAALILLAVWLVLGTAYWRRFPAEGLVVGFASVGALVLTVVGIALGFGWLVGLLPASIARLVSVAVVLGLAGAIVWYLRARLPVMAELFASFVRRGQWYMLPVLVGLLSLGGLLVVAASSPWLAPFIYTLF
jgi:uncharacterized protein DUF5989/acetyltransferase AlgX (SGNH hydrolase-like protein)